VTSQPPGASAGADRRAQRQAQTCAECGAQPSPGQSFCDDCGAVLRWTPAPAADGRASEPDPEGAPPEGGPAPDSGAGQPPGDALTAPVPAADAAADADAGAASAVDADRARALLVPVADSEPQTAQTPSVEPVLPGQPVAARPLVHAPGTDPGDEGGTPCPWCGTGNHPDRHFCRRCAMTMAGRPTDPAQRPWWRRLLDRRHREMPWAGDRPRLRHGLDRLLTWVGPLVVLALLVTAALNANAAVQAVRDHFADRHLIAVNSDDVHASNSYQGHGAQLAFDGHSDTWWGPGVTGSGQGQWLEVDFKQRIRLLNVIITSGKSTQPSDLAKMALPEDIEAVITADGRTTSRLLHLDQQNGPQTRDLRADNVTAVRFIVQSAYDADNPKQVSIDEIELFGPPNASG
jgi:hypothetical protein